MSLSCPKTADVFQLCLTQNSSGHHGLDSAFPSNLSWTPSPCRFLYSSLTVLSATQLSSLETIAPAVLTVWSICPSDLCVPASLSLGPQFQWHLLRGTSSCPCSNIALPPRPKPRSSPYSAVLYLRAPRSTWNDRMCLFFRFAPCLH